jgi:hypothetical protein
MNMSDRCRAFVVILLLFVFLVQCKCLSICRYSLSFNRFLICKYILHPHECIIYQVVLTRTSMLELQGGKLLLASLEMEKHVSWSTKAIEMSFAAVNSQINVTTHFRGVWPYATSMIASDQLPIQPMMHNLCNLLKAIYDDGLKTNIVNLNNVLHNDGNIKGKFYACPTICTCFDLFHVMYITVHIIFSFFLQLSCIKY